MCSDYWLTSGNIEHLWYLVSDWSALCVSQIASTHGSDDDDLSHRQPDD